MLRNLYIGWFSLWKGCRYMSRYYLKCVCFSSPLLVMYIVSLKPMRIPVQQIVTAAHGQHHAGEDIHTASHEGHSHRSRWICRSTVGHGGLTLEQFFPKGLFSLTGTLYQSREIVQGVRRSRCEVLWTDHKPLPPYPLHCLMMESKRNWNKGVKLSLGRWQRWGGMMF